MADEDLFASDDSPEPVAPVAIPAEVATPAPAPMAALASKAEQFEALVNQHFPHMLANGQTAHQPLRSFLLDVKRLFAS